MIYKIDEKERDVYIKLALKETVSKIEKHKINFSIITLKNFINLKTV